MNSKKSAVCYLTRIPDSETIQFAEELARDSRLASNVDIYIMVDDNNFQIQSNSLINFIQINNNECISNGYHSSNKLEMNKDCISWDKAIYYFCQIKQNDYSFVWLIEDDSFIPSVDAFFLLHNKYSNENNGGDLICQKNDENLYGDTSAWKWADVVGKFSPPWYHSMVCAIGCSRRLLDKIANYVKQRRFLPFIEYMFNTIAMQNHLKVINPPELSTIVFRENWTWEHVRQRPNNWFHPFKNEHVRRDIRSRMTNTEQMPSHNVGYTENIGYQGYTQYQGPMPQYPYFMPPMYNPPPNNGSVLPSILYYPPNMPPPYPPH
ncbi:unnamed protein product [Rotaria sp. Silwood2]|nr:unnamed protein product [Rotaria sp. Silwood2]CAF2641285.1 unnamed protein product [Rotaria sp. Silwood2]CAF4151929.1 unnamed protein product [Rotaria sp. Silwood2]CAF4269047.1 unnamed protein product [Rotaria sp. Silwood2]